jgi:phage terminase large subunit-like protein
MPWQQRVLDVGLELLPDGRPAFRDVGITVPRQSGKTTVVLGVETQRAIGWDERQHIRYSAQTGADARKKLLDDQFPLLEPHKNLLGIRQFMRANGSEGIVWRNGSRLSLMGSTSESGHGPTIDLAVKDELFADIDFRRDQALVPAMATRELAQAWSLSTAGTDESVALNQMVQRGRAAVEAGVSEGTAYFEWSACEGSDPNDEAVWVSCMPALGHTISLAAIRHARRQLEDDAEFMRAYLNIPTGSVDGRVFTVAQWDAVCRKAVKVDGDLVLAIDCTPERDAATLAVADERGRLEVFDHRANLSWVVGRAVEVAAARSLPVVLDPSGPVASEIPALHAAGLKVVEVSGREYAQACGAFFDAVVERRAAIRSHPGLDAAVMGLRKRTSGESWVWARRDNTVDVCPAIAATLAYWVATQVEVLRPFAY